MLYSSLPLISATVLAAIIIVIFPFSLILLLSDSTYILDWAIINIVSPINITIIFDPYGTIISSVVILISISVIIFSHSYIRQDPFINQFIIIVLLFVASINLLIFIPNLITLLIG